MGVVVDLTSEFTSEDWVRSIAGVDGFGLGNGLEISNGHCLGRAVRSRLGTGQGASTCRHHSLLSCARATAARKRVKEVV